MKNCLVTQLKGSVDANLEKFNEISISFPASAGATNVQVTNGGNAMFRFNSPYELKITGDDDIYLYVSQRSENVGQSYSTNRLDYSIFVKNPNNKAFTISAIPKYSLTSLILYELQSSVIKTSDIKYCTYISNIYDQGNTRLVGKLSDLMGLAIPITISNALRGCVGTIAEYLTLTGNVVANNSVFSFCNVSGDLSLIPSTTNRLRIPLGELTWTHRRTSGTILATEYSTALELQPFGFKTVADCDKFFIDNAKCTIGDYKQIQMRINNARTPYIPSSGEAGAIVAIAKLFNIGMTSIKINELAVSNASYIQGGICSITYNGNTYTEEDV